MDPLKTPEQNENSNKIETSSASRKLLELPKNGFHCFTIVSPITPSGNLTKPNPKKKKSPFSPADRENVSPNIDKSLTRRRILSTESWGKKQSPQKLNRISKKIEKEQTETGLSTSSTETYMIKDPFIIAAASNVDLVSRRINLNDQWINEQEIRFKKWFNTLLAPIELETDIIQPINASKIWMECLKKEVSAPPTKETISIRYHTKSKLDLLRKKAKNFYESSEIQAVFTKISTVIESGKFEIRPDRNVHLDIIIQKNIVTLLLSYNPLWLRIGLETIYDEVLQLNSNSDIFGLSRFICERFFKDPHLLKKYKNVYHPKYAGEIKKFILAKFLYLVYFLDKAKIEVLIRHDPCLFRKNSAFKESREILIEFSKEAITGGVGDINRYLKHFGYVVHHKQTYIHEFDYAVKDLGIDLRDGVRLARTTELILLKNGIIDNLRVPAISRLQKIHNVKIVFKMLKNAGFQTQFFEAFHIVDGHKMETLSFLWHIIYEFKSPLVVKSVEKVQQWWRSFPIHVKRLKLKKIYEKNSEAATIIQNWYRKLKRRERDIEIERLLKIYNENYQKLVDYHENRSRATMLIQQKFRAYKLMKIQRNEYLKIRTSAIIIQNQIRAYILKKNCKSSFNHLKTCTIFIQRKFRAQKAMRAAKKQYDSLRKAAIIIQTMYRSNRIMREERQKFLYKKNCCVKIQRYFRAYLLMKTERQKFLKLRSIVCMIKDRFKAKKAMEACRNHYLELRKAAIFIQRKFRAKRQMKEVKLDYTKKLEAARKIQHFFRNYRQMKADRVQFLADREVRRVQEKAAVKIQAFWRGHVQRSNSGDELKTIRKKLEMAQKEANSGNTLASRGKTGIQGLIAEEVSIPVIIYSLQDLEYATRRSKELCKKYGSLLPEQMYMLILSASRSLAEVEIYVQATNILINFCKYPPTTAMTWFPEHLEGIFNRMMHWCDKEEDIFPSLVTLLWLFAHNENYKKEICNLPLIHQKMEKIQILIERKEKMVRKSRRSGPSRFSTFRFLPTPGLTPDWGFDYPNRPKAFTNSIHAFNCLIEILNLS